MSRGKHKDCNHRNDDQVLEYLNRTSMTLLQITSQFTPQDLENFPLRQTLPMNGGKNTVPALKILLKQD